MSDLVKLPTSSNQDDWSDEEKALVEAAGLVATDSRSGAKELAPRPVVAAFLQHCARTGLDPIARQIYCLGRKSKGQLKWQIQISIDGARLVAERTREYEGQTPVQWTADGRTWVDVWLEESYPKAARVGVYRRGFREPLFAVARWDSYVVMQDEWSGGQKTGRQAVSSMWAKMPDLMLGKVAEMLALRKAFPQDLSGLYSAEEMAQADAPRGTAQTPVKAPEPVQASRDWASEILAAKTLEALTTLYREAQELREMNAPAGQTGDNDDGSPATVMDLFWSRRRELEAAAEEPYEGDIVPDEVVVVDETAEEPVTDWEVAKIPGASDE